MPSSELPTSPTPPLTLPDLTPLATWSIVIRDLSSGGVLAERAPSLVLKTASVGKLFILAEAAARIEAGTLDPVEELAPTPEEWVADSGIFYLMQRQRITVADACLLVGAFSDNMAANVLITRLGLDAIHERTHALGYEDSALLDLIRNERTPEMPWTLSIGSANELGDFAWRTARRELISPAVSDRIARWLAADADLSMVAGAFDLDPLAHSDPDNGIELANKTGSILTARIDVGWVRNLDTHRGVAYAVLANWPDGEDATARGPVLASMQEVGRSVRAHLAAD